jgi:hypothetical protein
MQNKRTVTEDKRIIIYYTSVFHLFNGTITNESIHLSLWTMKYEGRYTLLELMDNK